MARSYTHAVARTPRGGAVIIGGRVRGARRFHGRRRLLIEIVAHTAAAVIGDRHSLVEFLVQRALLRRRVDGTTAAAAGFLVGAAEATTAAATGEDAVHVFVCLSVRHGVRRPV